VALEVQVNILPPGINGPGIDLIVEGGTMGYSFLWSNGSTSEDLILLPSGIYQCTVTDANGCTFVTDPVRILNPRDFAIQRPESQVHILGNPSDVPIVIIVDSKYAQVHSMFICDALGRPVAKAEWQGMEYEIDLRANPPGIYFLAVFEQQTLLKTIRLSLTD
jgi:hypothetical protein